MKRIIREPLLHFLLLGAAIFLGYHFISARSGNQPDKIIITQGDIMSIATGFARTWQRRPHPEELAGLIRERVRQEVYYREAIAMGLDRDDPVIRRRLQQKLRFVTDDVTAPPTPSDAELSEYLKAHANVFWVDQRFSFSQVYLDPAKHGETLTQDANELLAALRALQGKDHDVSTLGDNLLLEHRFDAAPASEVAKQFGDRFAAKLAQLPVGQWSGPVESGYGIHLVFLQERSEGHLPELSEVREAVQREWSNARQAESNEQYFQSLLKQYEVVVETADLAEAGQKVANAK